MAGLEASSGEAGKDAQTPAGTWGFLEVPAASWTLFNHVTRCRARRWLRFRLISGAAAGKQDALAP